MNRFSFNYFHELKTLVTKSWKTFLILLKFMIPISITIRFLTEFGLIEVLSEKFDPIMQLIGLPGIFALVFITAIISNLYAALIAFIAIYQPNLFTVAEVSQLGLMMLIVHNLPIELAVAHRAGVHFLRALFLRIFIAFLSSYLIHLFCTLFNLYHQPAILTLGDQFSQTTKDLDWIAWMRDEVINYAWIYIIITLVMILLRITEMIHLKFWMEKYLAKYLQKIGISTNATLLVIVGLSIGIAYGGGLIIKEAEANQMSRQDIFFSISFLSLLHALIEDTAIILFLGADIFIVLFFRIFMTIISMYSLYKFSELAQQKNWKKFHQIVFGYQGEEKDLKVKP